MYVGKLYVIRHTIVVQIFDYLREVLLGLLVQIGDGNAGCKHSIIRMFCRKIRSSLRSKVLMKNKMQAMNDQIARNVHQARRSSRLDTLLQRPSV